ncbi:LytTR family transcriptional regulator [Frateuria sp. Soil773]|uniref:LytR/AlgR family response regulator transcription factor n=1 Tax=Frateuria sp. Soil773 TaxID=1736407 RepID=UPI0006FDE710|nr:response regulator [Frateuria sp. Soil773]KRF00561.1 LytTR family transcriptional regulator [Frateuria sp. Soil773]
MNLPRLRTVLVDDEVLARLALRQALASHAEVEIVGECGNADEAMQLVQALQPDLLFLDIQMPGMDGFGLLHELSPERLPLVVFTTAFAEHALRAFDANALDYVLKPFAQARFDQAMARVLKHWQGLHAGHGPLAEQPAAASAGSGYAQRISVRSGERLHVLATDDIDWIRADGNYLHLHVNGARFLHRDTLQHLLAMLDPACFLRIHRGIVVNLARVAEIHPLFQGNAEVVLRDGTRLTLSRRFRVGAMAALGLRRSAPARA